MATMGGQYFWFGLQTQRVAHYDWYCLHVVASTAETSLYIAPTQQGPKTLSLIVACTAVPAWPSMQPVANVGHGLQTSLRIKAIRNRTIGGTGWLPHWPPLELAAEALA